MPGKMNFEFTVGRAPSPSSQTLESDDPLRILILGNFSGSTAGARVPLQKRPFVRVDIDNFDKVLQRFAPRVLFGDDTLAEAVEIQALDDFRPERLCEKLPTLRRLADLRRSLLNPATFAQAAAELRQQLLVAPVSANPPADSSAPTVASAENDAATLERILGQSPPARTSQPNPADRLPFDMQRLIGQMVQPYLIPAADPNQQVYLAAANNALGDRMRAILHDQSFQTLEATWRSLRGLISKVEDDRQIQIHLLDVTPEELRQDLPTNDEHLEQWSLYRRLTDAAGQSIDTPPWSLMVGDFTITASSADLTLLGALAAVAQRLRTPLIAASDSSLLGCTSLVADLDPANWQPLAAEVDQYWQTLRRSQAAPWVGLVCPRVLLRLPYGQETDEVESLEFEEFSSTRSHADYLWGNGAYLCADLIQQAFAEEAGAMQLVSQVDIDDLPAYTYREDGDVEFLPCAEVVFGERVAEAFLQRGVMPLVSWKDRNAVRFFRFQSIANPATPLAGRWS